MSKVSASPDRHNRPLVGIAFALASTVLYGVVPAGTSLAFQHGVSPIEVTLFRTALVTVGMLAIALALREKIRFPKGLSGVFWLQAFSTLVICRLYSSEPYHSHFLHLSHLHRVEWSIYRRKASCARANGGRGAGLHRAWCGGGTEP